MSILSRAISRLPQAWARLTARSAPGVDAGSRRVHWLTRPAVGRRGVFPPQVRAQVTAIACSLPCQQQVPLSRWSRAELARRVAQDPSLPRLDEKTSIQAREGEQPPRPARPGKPLLHEARYHRRGARHLFVGLSVADGEVYGTCRQRKCFVDFQAFVQQHIIPEALRRRVHTVTLILDNGTTHAPKQLEGWLREQERACDERLHFQVLWLPTNASWLDQIEIWFSVLQRKHLQPNQFANTKDLETSLSTYIAYYNQAAKPINWTYTVEKLEHKLGKQL